MFAKCCNLETFLLNIVSTCLEHAVLFGLYRSLGILRGFYKTGPSRLCMQDIRKLMDLAIITMKGKFSLLIIIFIILF